MLADRELLSERARLLQLPLETTAYVPAAGHGLNPGISLAGCKYCTFRCPTFHPRKARFSQCPLCAKNAGTAVEGCRKGEFSGMVTAPVHKGIINDAGIAFTGHTEYLAQLTDSQAVMLLVGGGMRVTLATTHLPLKDVAAAITRETLEQKLRIIHTT